MVVVSGFLSVAPMPVDDPIAQPKRLAFERRVDPFEGLITRAWTDYFTALQGNVESATANVAAVALPGTQSGSIGATDVSSGDLTAGVYFFSYYISITQAASGSGDVTVTLDWLDGGNAKSYVGPTLSSNVVTASQSAVTLIRTDAAAPVRYSVAYNSVGATPLLYSLDVVLERP